MSNFGFLSIYYLHFLYHSHENVNDQDVLSFFLVSSLIYKAKFSLSEKEDNAKEVLNSNNEGVQF